MSDSKVLHWWESDSDLKVLQNNDWKLNLTRGVKKDSGEAQTNHVWKVVSPARSADIKWVDDYAINWTSTVPARDQSLQLGAKWQSVKRGQAWNVNPYGLFVPPGTAGSPDSFTISNNGYKQPLHIIIGNKNVQTQEYDPIYIDLTDLTSGNTSQYSPTYRVSWFLTHSSDSGGVQWTASTEICSLDYNETTAKVEQWTTYSWGNQAWKNSSTIPPQLAHQQ